ncbi:MAG: bifunctional hydroxymethylpyrimidine kinase/phosphomethylpyrimidine kinase [Opitutaceae bacterium]|nr:bifunctional hydroxymethylpyrimidine kinase/phosphomethylpyrimidine kinase [Opitutaceae bacterium]
MRPVATPASRPSATPVALSVAGSDSGAGAGIQADLLTFSAIGVFGTTAITCLTAQNPDNVTAVHPAPAEVVAAQIEAVFGYFPVRAVKTGMLFNPAIIAAVSDALGEHRRVPLVVDPVMVSTSGSVLLESASVDALCTRIFPMARLITPNLDESAVLLGRRPDTRSELIDAAAFLSDRFHTGVLLKGGHLHGQRLTDVLAQPGGKIRAFDGSRIAGVDTHGSGCTLSAAITANLALGCSLEASVASARRYLRRGMSHPLKVAGRRFIAH